MQLSITNQTIKSTDENLIANHFFDSPMAQKYTLEELDEQKKQEYIRVALQRWGEDCHTNPQLLSVDEAEALMEYGSVNSFYQTQYVDDRSLINDTSGSVSDGTYKFDKKEHDMHEYFIIPKIFPKRFGMRRRMLIDHQMNASTDATAFARERRIQKLMDAFPPQYKKGIDFIRSNVLTELVSFCQNKREDTIKKILASFMFKYQHVIGMYVELRKIIKELGLKTKNVFQLTASVIEHFNPIVLEDEEKSIVDQNISDELFLSHLNASLRKLRSLYPDLSFGEIGRTRDKYIEESLDEITILSYKPQISAILIIKQLLHQVDEVEINPKFAEMCAHLSSSDEEFKSMYKILLSLLNRLSNNYSKVYSKVIGRGTFIRDLTQEEINNLVPLDVSKFSKELRSSDQYVELVDLDLNHVSFLRNQHYLVNNTTEKIQTIDLNTNNSRKLDFSRVLKSNSNYSGLISDSNTNSETEIQYLLNNPSNTIFILRTNDDIALLISLLCRWKSGDSDISYQIILDQGSQNCVSEVAVYAPAKKQLQFLYDTSPVLPDGRKVHVKTLPNLSNFDGNPCNSIDEPTLFILDNRNNTDDLSVTHRFIQKSRDLHSYLILSTVDYTKITRNILERLARRESITSYYYVSLCLKGETIFSWTALDRNSRIVDLDALRKTALQKISPGYQADFGPQFFIGKPGGRSRYLSMLSHTISEAEFGDNMPAILWFGEPEELKRDLTRFHRGQSQFKHDIDKYLEHIIFFPTPRSIEELRDFISEDPPLWGYHIILPTLNKLVSHHYSASHVADEDRIIILVEASARKLKQLKQVHLDKIKRRTEEYQDIDSKHKDAIIELYQIELQKEFERKSQQMQQDIMRLKKNREIFLEELQQCTPQDRSKVHQKYPDGSFNHNRSQILNVLDQCLRSIVAAKNLNHNFCSFAADISHEVMFDAERATFSISEKLLISKRLKNKVHEMDVVSIETALNQFLIYELPKFLRPFSINLNLIWGTPGKYDSVTSYRASLNGTSTIEWVSSVMKVW